jgi:hypothetical protein
MSSGANKRNRPRSLFVIAQEVRGGRAAKVRPAREVQVLPALGRGAEVVGVVGGRFYVSADGGEIRGRPVYIGLDRLLVASAVALSEAMLSSSRIAVTVAPVFSTKLGTVEVPVKVGLAMGALASSWV